MIGDKLKQILDIYHTVSDRNDGSACICVHGTHGSGKTALLDKLSNAMLLSGINVFYAVGMQPSENKPVLGPATAKLGDSALRELLRQLTKIYGSKYSTEFVNFITSYVKGNLADESEPPGLHRYKKDAIIKFIYDCIKSEPIVLIVDDLDLADNFTVNLIGGLLSTNALSFLAFSHSDKLENALLEDILYRNAAGIEYIQLNTDDDTAKNKSVSESDSHIDGINDNAQPLLDEIVLVLSKPGRERQLIRHYVNNAERLFRQMAYENTALSLSAAIDVYKKLRENPGDTTDSADITAELDLLIRLAEVQILDKQYESAIRTLKKAYMATEPETVPPDSTKEDFLFMRAAISVKLAQCYSRLGMQDSYREHVLLTEAFFCLPERRVRHYDLYTEYIPKYLYFLTELFERTIFREKLKQAYSVCRIDDNVFDATLRYEEGLMHSEYGDFEKAHELLTEARNLAEELDCGKLWDDSTNALAICSEQMGNKKEAECFWREIINKSHDPAKAAGAIINIAAMNYENDMDMQKAAAGFQTGIDLCVIANELQIAKDIMKNVEGSEPGSGLSALIKHL